MAGGVNTHDSSSSADTGAPKQLQAGLFPPQQLQAGLFPPAAPCAATEEHKPSRAYESPRADGDEDDAIPSEEHPAFAALGDDRSQQRQQQQQQEEEQRRAAKAAAGASADACASVGDASAEAVEGARFSAEETVLIFDWDDTVLPSTWVQCQGLRLDQGSELSAWQREQLVEVATVAAETLRRAKECGTVVLVTNAERGWIELSCQKFMPTLMPSLENVKIMSARTTYESEHNASPLDWKLRAFEDEIRRVYGSATLVDLERRKNVLSLGDSVHEREALLRATALLPSCRAKSLKFVERPDIAQICKQHSLVASCFDRIVHHDGNLDLCIRCA